LKIDSNYDQYLAINYTRKVLIWKAIEYIGLLIFIMFVPPMMGPNLYGKFALLLSIIGLITLATGIGVQQIFGRFIPEYITIENHIKVQNLFIQILSLRTFVAIIGTVLFLVLFPKLLPKISIYTLIFGSGALLLGIILVTLYQFLYGLDNLDKWLSNISLSKLTLVVLILAIGGWTSLERATIALFINQLVFATIGILWTRQYLKLNNTTFQFSFLYSHLNFGLLFFIANLLFMLVWRGGELIVFLLTKQSIEVAFFSITNFSVIALASLIAQLSNTIIPSSMKSMVTGEKEKVKSLMGYTLKYLTILSFSFIFIVYILGSFVVKLLLGKEYLPVVDSLKILSLSLIPITFIRICLSKAVIRKEPVKAIKVTAGALLTFIIVSIFIVPHYGSSGACLAIVIAMAIAGFIAYSQFYTAPILAEAHFWKLIIMGFIAMSVMFIPIQPALAMGILSIVIYLALILLGKVISTNEIQQISQVFGNRK